MAATSENTDYVQIWKHLSPGSQLFLYGKHLIELSYFVIFIVENKLHSILVDTVTCEKEYYKVSLNRLFVLSCFEALRQVINLDLNLLAGRIITKIDDVIAFYLVLLQTIL